MEIVLQPGYVSKFTCIASDCEDTCCCGWRITIDKESYEKYKSLEACGDELFSGRLTREDVASAEGYAEVALEANSCPFLNEKKLCSIQKKYGESYLSVTCAVFPRNYNLVDGGLELSLNMSCPHAARLALLDPSPMRFSAVSTDMQACKMPELYSTEARYPNYAELREFVIGLLQNRSYNFEDRLVILGRFCSDMENSQDGGQLAKLINEYQALIDSFGFGNFIKSLPEQPAAMLNTVINLIEYRIKTDFTGERFLECLGRFKEGLDLTNDETLADSYSKTKAEFYEPFMVRQEYILENYFVNYAFKTLFPLGLRKGSFKNDTAAVPNTAFTEYMLLAVQYAMIKDLLIGISGYWKGEFGTQHVIKLLQSFDKNIGRDIPYLQTLLRFFNDNNGMNLACAVMLIKN